jgi:hypothetical protein
MDLGRARQRLIPTRDFEAGRLSSPRFRTLGLQSVVHGSLGDPSQDGPGLGFGGFGGGPRLDAAESRELANGDIEEHFGAAVLGQRPVAEDPLDPEQLPLGGVVVTRLGMLVKRSVLHVRAVPGTRVG